MTTAFPPVPPPPGPPPATPPQSVAPPRRLAPLTKAIVLALALSASYGIAQILYWQQPEITSPTPWMRVWQLPETEQFKTTRVLLIIGWSIAALLTVALGVSRRTGPRPSRHDSAPPFGAPLPPTSPPSTAQGSAPGRDRTVFRCQLGILGALVLPFSWIALDTLVHHPLTLLVCLPTTVIVLLVLHRVQLYRRIPVWLMLIGFGWGVLVGDGFGQTMLTWFQRYAAGYLLDWQHPRDMIRRLYTLLALNNGVFSELGKAVGVAILFLVARRYFDNVVSGVVIGATIGLGANLPETVRYMATIDPTQESTQFWMRQVICLPASHVAFTAVVGAGFGAARRLTERRDRLLAASGGLIAAIGGHFATAAVEPQLGKWKEKMFGDNQTLILLLGVPMTMLVTSGVYVAAYVIILHRGLTAQAHDLRPALQCEAHTGSNAITTPEIDLLLSPRRRLLLELRVWRRDGTAGLRLLTRLHQTQLALATTPSVIPEAHRLRNRARRLKGLPPIPDTASEFPASSVPVPTQGVLS
ncbi:PrsW family glutamic-type intramembrane protease [Streptomyces sp. T-3]|nr:PrsW family glutamic-type intramembrane protease [Streptomyces sp. T-3]